MKTINFLTSHFLPENTACTNRVLAYVKELEKVYKINIICLTEKGVESEKNVVQYSDNITIYYHTQSDFDGKNFFKRAFYEVKHIGHLLKTARILRSDLTIATTPYMFMIPLVAFGIKGKKTLDIRDMVWEYLGKESLFKRLIKRSLEQLMSFSMKRYNQVLVTNGYEYTLATQKYNLSNVHIVQNGISEENYYKLLKIRPQLDQQFTVTYIGNLGLAQNIMTLILAAEKLPSIKFIIIGDGIEAMKLKEYTQTHQLNNIEFTGKLNWEELSSYYEKSSVLYAQLDAKFISAMPSKLYEYSSIALPIIYAGEGEARRFVEKLDNAVGIQPNNVNLLVQTIENLSKEKVRISLKNREQIAKNFLREKIVQKIFSRLFTDNDHSEVRLLQI